MKKSKKVHENKNIYKKTQTTKVGIQKTTEHKKRKKNEHCDIFPSLHIV